MSSRSSTASSRRTSLSSSTEASPSTDSEDEGALVASGTTQSEKPAPNSSLVADREASYCGHATQSINHRLSFHHWVERYEAGRREKERREIREAEQRIEQRRRELHAITKQHDRAQKEFQKWIEAKAAKKDSSKDNSSKTIAKQPATLQALADRNSASEKAERAAKVQREYAKWLKNHPKAPKPDGGKEAMHAGRRNVVQDHKPHEHKLTFEEWRRQVRQRPNYEFFNPQPWIGVLDDI